MQHQCEASKKNIFLLLTTFQDIAPETEQLQKLIQQIRTKVNDIMNAHISHNASQTWGSRAREMDEIMTKLAEDVTNLKQADDKELFLKNMVEYWFQQPLEDTTIYVSAHRIVN